MYKKIVDYIREDIYPFHMPGHKRNPLFVPPNLLDLDITEIPGMDVLSRPTGIIDELQKEIAKFYGADYSFLLVNGSSAGIIAAVCAACPSGETIVVPRNAHSSVYNAMVLCGANPKYIIPEITPDGLAGGISPDAFNFMPNGAAALVVSPTYEGFVSDIFEIAKRVHSKGGILIVDEAHGAHFPFSQKFPVTALSQGADIVVQSLHKTLPAPSQCAVLHVKSKRVNLNRIKFFINSVQTTSPSYILMSVCDYMFRLLWQQPQFFHDYFFWLKKLREHFPGAKSSSPLRLSGNERVGENAIFDIDPGKLLFSLHTSACAKTVAQIMADEYRVQPEMAAGRHILAMTSVADTNKGFNRLINAVNGLNSKLPVISTKNTPPQPFSLPEVVLPPRQAVNMQSEEVFREKAIGRVSAQLIAKYPPGIAILTPGERVNVLPRKQKSLWVIKDII